MNRRLRMARRETHSVGQVRALMRSAGLVRSAAALVLFAMLTLAGCAPATPFFVVELQRPATLRVHGDKLTPYSRPLPGRRVEWGDCLSFAVNRNAAVITAWRDGALRLFEPGRPAPRTVADVYPVAVAWSNDGGQLAALVAGRPNATRATELRFFTSQLAAGDVIRLTHAVALDPAAGEPACLSWSADDRWLACSPNRREALGPANLVIFDRSNRNTSSYSASNAFFIGPDRIVASRAGLAGQVRGFDLTGGGLQERLIGLSGEHVLASLATQGRWLTLRAPNPLDAGAADAPTIRVVIESAGALRPSGGLTLARTSLVSLAPVSPLPE